MLDRYYAFPMTSCVSSGEGTPITGVFPDFPREGLHLVKQNVILLDVSMVSILVGELKL